jgi:hypothetical protein
VPIFATSFVSIRAHDILITSIGSFPKWLQIKFARSMRAFEVAMEQQSFAAVLAPNETRGFPIVLRRGELLDEQSKERGWFVICVHWRKTRSPCARRSSRVKFLAAVFPPLPALIVSIRCCSSAVGRYRLYLGCEVGIFIGCLRLAGRRDGLSDFVTLQAGHGIPSPHSQPFSSALFQGLSGWFSQTQPRSSQRGHRGIASASEWSGRSKSKTSHPRSAAPPGYSGF